MSEWRETDFGKIPNQWGLKKIDELKDNGKYAIAMGPFGSNIKAENFVSNGVPVIRGTNLNYARYVDGDFVFLTKEKATELKSSNCKPGDLIFVHRGTIGQVAIIPHHKYEDYIVSQSGMKLTVNTEIASNLFVFYFFKSVYGQHQLLKHEAQVGVPSISNPLTSLKNIEIPFPPLPEQKAIAAVLSSLDDKIDLLHRQNQTLEALAQTLFRQWFIEEARPEWDVVIMDDIVSIKGGTTPSTKISEYWDGNINWTSPRDLSNHRSVFLFDTERKITGKGLAQIGSGLLPINTVLLSSRAPIGYLAITQIPVAINQGYIGIICDKHEHISNYFIYLWCQANMEELKNSGNGSVFQELPKSTFKQFNLILPPTQILKAFDNLVSDLFRKIKINQLQIRTLENLRDTLLPKLMSGEVRVAL